MTIKEENHLEALANKHKLIDEQIKEYEMSPSVDDATLNQLKKEKLAVKDEIFAFKRQMAKDILSAGLPKE